MRCVGPIFIPPVVSELPLTGEQGQILTVGDVTYWWDEKSEAWVDVMALDSGETEYSPGLVPTVVTDAGDTVVYQPTDSTKAFVIHSTYAVPVVRGAEDAPVITIKVLNPDDSLFKTLFSAAAISKRKKITCPVNAKIVVSLDIGARVPCTFDIQEFVP